MNQNTQQLTASDMQRGERYNWKHQSERLVYRGKKGSWHQFSKAGSDGIWCEVLDEDLHMLERTQETDQ